MADLLNAPKDVLVLLETPGDPTRWLAAQLEASGYQVLASGDPATLAQSLAEVPIRALVVNLEALDDTPDMEGLRSILEFRPAHLPLLVISPVGDLPTQLQAVRLGCDAFFTRPLDFQGFVDKLDALLHPAEPDSIRVLIVEDSRTLAAMYSQVLQGAGMVTQAVTDPLLALDAMSEFRPDLVLMDMYMPGCTGMELASALRMNPAYLSIPIVYLSSETDTQKQMTARLKGGDDFLTKPIDPDHLIDAVRARADRTRILRNFMVRDSLTGLFNHSTLKQRLAEEVSRSMRSGAPLAFAMLDIDHFKRVNDTHGHPTGDRVILSLARLLQRRLRKADVVGRYGGEEFAVILPDTPPEGARQALDAIREDFATLLQRGPEAEFQTTFSCGIATCPPLGSAKELNDRADEALYEAKRGGRNQVVLAR